MDKHWKLVKTAYLRWVDKQDEWIASSLELGNPTVKNAILLALLETQGRYISYEEINKILDSRGIIDSAIRGEKGIPVVTLRVALYELTKKLERMEHFFRIRTERMGKRMQFALVDKSEKKTGASDLIRNANEPLIEPRDITRRLVQDGGGLPFASSYCCARAAAHWLHFSTAQGSKERRKYEADAFDAYQLNRILGIRGFNGDMGVVSLATGEGPGEIDLLDRLLRATDKPRPRRVQYVAIDTSEFLLTAHSQIVRERFSKELMDGSLIYAPLVGDLFQLNRCLAKIRYKLGDSFLSEMPILCTYYGNCLGNYENHEWDFFRSVTEAIPKDPLAILVGVSVLRRKGEKPNGKIIEEKSYTLESFYLETPRHLMYDLQLLFSEGVKGQVLREDKLVEFCEEGTEPIPCRVYDTGDGIQGSVYRVNYQLKYSLVTWDGKQRLPSGSNLLLYSIVKYDLGTLKAFLETRGFEVLSPPNEYFIQKLGKGGDEFRYAVFAATLRHRV